MKFKNFVILLLHILFISPVFVSCGEACGCSEGEYADVKVLDTSNFKEYPSHSDTTMFFEHGKVKFYCVTEVVRKHVDLYEFTSQYFYDSDMYSKGETTTTAVDPKYITTCDYGGYDDCVRKHEEWVEGIRKKMFAINKK